jgi:hypothetical protein
LHPTKCVCGNKLASRKLGRPQKFCSDNCRKAHSKWNVRTYGPQRRRNVPKRTKSDNSTSDFGDLPLSILGPRFPWEKKPIDPRVMEAIRHKEMGPIPSAVTTKNQRRSKEFRPTRPRNFAAENDPVMPMQRSGDTAQASPGFYANNGSAWDCSPNHSAPAKEPRRP